MQNIINNGIGLGNNESSILTVVQSHLENSLSQNKKVSLYIAANFNFFKNFKSIIPILDKLYKKDLLENIKILLGNEVRKSIKDFIFLLRNDSITLDEEDFEFLYQLHQDEILDIHLNYETNFKLKLYILEEDSKLSVWNGSGDFLQQNEVNTISLVTEVQGTAQELEQYRSLFTALWKKSQDSINEHKIFDILQEAASSEFISLSIRKFISSLLISMEKEYLVTNISFDLSKISEFQNMSYYLCIEKLRNFGGCIFINSIGLSKTYISSMIIKHYINNGKRILVVHADETENTWEANFEKTAIIRQNVLLLNRNLLEKSDCDLSEYSDIDLIICDRAEYFAFARGNSYRLKNLEKVLKANPQTHTLFISEKIINDSIDNLVSIVKFINRQKNSIVNREIERFEELRETGEISEHLINTIKNLLSRYSVNIEWSNISEFLTEKEMKTIEYKKPMITTVKYAYDHEINAKLHEKKLYDISKLTFEYVKLSFEEYYDNPELLKWYIWKVYKKAESSITSFIDTLQNILDKTYFVKNFLTDKSYHIDTKLFTNEQILNIQKCFDKVPEDMINSIMLNLDNDIRVIEAILEAIKGIRYLENRDDKIINLLKIIKSENKPTVIYTECRETIYYIKRRLKDYGITNIKTIIGGEPSIEGWDAHNEYTENITEICDSFNKGDFDILISNDVIEEDISLSRANVLVNFDIPLNPIVLSKRNRKIYSKDPNRITRIYNFQSDKRIDKEVKILELINCTIKDIIAYFGLNYLLWCKEERRIENITDADNEKVLFATKDYKDFMARKDPEDFKNKFIPQMSREDIVLREYIKILNISEETLKLVNNRYNKPIFTSLKTEEAKFNYVIYKYKEHILTINKLLFSDTQGNGTFEHSELEKLQEFIAEDLKKQEVYRSNPPEDEQETDLSVIGIIKYNP